MIRGDRTGPLFAALCGALIACSSPDASQFRPLAPGDDAPAFAAADENGVGVAIDELEGTPVLLNIWATWCIPCRQEMPALQTLHERYGERGLRVVGVSIDRGNAAHVFDFAHDLGVDFTILHDPAESVTRAFRTTGVPETFLIDTEGRIAHRWIGAFDPLSTETLQRIDSLF